MIGKIFSINFHKPKYLLSLFLVFFAVSVLNLQNLKAPWVDECYSYYGVWHDSFSEFYNSMLTGINFSPPLYFLFNFCIQLVLPTSIDQLRLQSLIFIIIGIVLSFLLTRKVFSTLPAFVATILVLSQSDLIISQAQEARHYAMFFACGAWVLYEQTFSLTNSKRTRWLLFIAHLSLSLVHYLGIIFSGLVAVALLIFNMDKPVTKRIPYSIYISWIIAVPFYLILIYNQSSHLGTWSRSNYLIDLLSIYNDSLLLLSLIVPIIIVLCIVKTKSSKPTAIPPAHNILFATSLLWFATPLLFWILSICSNVNLFKDRYFMPKEAAIIIITAFLINLLINKMKSTLKIGKNSLLPIGGTLILALAIFSLVIKRSLFAIKPERNFYYWLLVKDKISKSNLPLVFVGDLLFFPNAYQLPQNSFFLLNDSNLKEVYKKFSNKIHIINNECLTGFESFILICDTDFNRDVIDANFIQQDLGTIHDRLEIHIIQFDKINQKIFDKFN